MDLPRFSATVRRITILNRDEETGRVVPVVVFDKGRKKKKGTRAARPIERFTRRFFEANSAAAEKYLKAHKKANRKRRDGWIRDVHVNLFDAGRKGWKKADPGKLIDL